MKKDKIRVLQVGMTRYLGGIETYLIEQFRHLDTNVISYDFINITGEYSICYQEEIESFGSKVFPIVSRHKNPLLHYWQWIKLLWKNRNIYDVIVLNTNSLEYIFPLVIGKIFKIPIRAIHSHNSGFENKQGILRRLLVTMNTKLMNWSATLRLACSRTAGQWMFGKKDFKVIYNAIELERYHFQENIREEKRAALKLDDKFVLLHIGRFSYQKNHDFLIDIFAEVYKINKNAKLLLVGDIEEDNSFYQDVLKKVNSLGLTDVVLFMGRRDDVFSLMQAADVLVMPSRFEGLTLVGVEAQAADLPLILSNTVTEELKILDSTKFLSLSESSKVWAKAAIESKNDSRSNTYEKMKAAGYDINTEAIKIQKMYLDS